MLETEFNLIDAPWIRVLDKDCRLREVSLKDALLHAREFQGLSGELPTQDVAVLRLLLAVLHTLISRYDAEGAACALEEDEYQALERWQQWWERGSFPERAVTEYLTQWHERFWLFHPERPFFQVAGIKTGTSYNAPKLNGEISESNNKVRLFSSYSGEEKRTMSYAQAARWLLYLNAYDDASGKPTSEGKAKAGGHLPSVGTGWLGQLGLVYLTGDSLFETLMLNLIMVNGSQDVQCVQKPVWERETVATAERVKIPMPDNLAELYTLQSRRILLKREQDAVVGYILLGGDFFPSENAFFEPMTAWREASGKTAQLIPKRHDSSRQMWREFSALFQGEHTGKNKRAGVIEWYCEHLLNSDWTPKDPLVTTAIASVEYGAKNSSVDHVFSDSLTMHADLLQALGKDLRSLIEGEIRKCGDLAGCMADFAKDLFLASGGSSQSASSIGQRAKEQLYYRLDLPFRTWLRGIDPKEQDEARKEAVLTAWRGTAKSIAKQYAKELETEQPETAILGRTIETRPNEKTKKTFYSVATAKRFFLGKINGIYGKDVNT